jgi:hypothetical protein
MIFRVQPIAVACAGIRVTLPTAYYGTKNLLGLDFSFIEHLKSILEPIKYSRRVVVICLLVQPWFMPM